MTPALVIEKYLALRETKKKLVAEQKAQIAEYDDAMAAMENYLMSVMDERGEKQIKTDAGTAFKTTTTHAKLVDRAAVEAFAKANDRLDIFTNAVSKDFIKEWVETHGAPPAGTELTTIMDVNVRKA